MIDIPTEQAVAPERIEKTPQQMAQASLVREAAAARYQGKEKETQANHVHEMDISAIAADKVRDQIRDMQVIPPPNKATLIGENANIRVHMHPGLVDKTKIVQSPVSEKNPEAA